VCGQCGACGAGSTATARRGELPPLVDREQLRREAAGLLPAGEADGTSVAAAELAVASRYGFDSWAGLVREGERREILDAGDVARLEALLAEEPALARTTMEHWCDHPRGSSPLGYVAMRRYDTSRKEWRDVTGTDEVARVLLAAGAPVDGEPGERETPLITAASYGDAAVALVLIEAGAELEARAADDAGGVPGATALLHAAVFGMTDVVDVLVAAGARVESVEVAAAAGDIRGWLDDAPADARLRALVMAADHERLHVIDELVESGTAIDGTDPVFGGHPLRTAASNGRAASVRHLLGLGAEPKLRDAQDRSALELARGGTTPGHREVVEVLAPLAGAE